MGRRQDPTPLSTAAVIAVAVGIADNCGLAGVTMRRVASELGCEAMSLYHHVASKDALLAGMGDAVVAEIAAAHAAVPDGRDGWQRTVRSRCLLARDVMITHRWAPALLATRTTMPAPLPDLYEGLLATLFSAGLSDSLVHRAVHTLGSLVLGFSNELFNDEADDVPDAAMLEQLEAVMPNSARLARSAVHEAEGSLGGCDTQAEFEFTLDLVLDGLAAHHRRAASASPAGSVSP